MMKRSLYTESSRRVRLNSSTVTRCFGEIFRCALTLRIWTRRRSRRAG
jgi:hypothetical protein